MVVTRREDCGSGRVHGLLPVTGGCAAPHGGQVLGRWRPRPVPHQTGRVTVAEVIGTFARAWNTIDDAERLRLLTASCLPDAVFAAPQGSIAGIGALSASIAGFRRAFPAAVAAFGLPEEHGGFVRVAWSTRWNGGQPDLFGEDFAQLAGDGRIRLLVSFDRAPQPCL